MNLENENLVKNIRNGDKESLDTLMLKLEKMIKYFEKDYKIERANVLSVIYRILSNKNLNIDNLKNYLFI